MGCYNSTVLNVPVKKAWTAIQDFHNLEWAKGVIETIDIVGKKKGTEVGAQRVINSAFHETLTEINPETFNFKYTITDGPGAVAKDTVKNYIGEVQLFPITDTNQTYFLWKSTFDSPDDKAVLELCDPIYQSLLKVAKDTIK